jgi:hypothetical protein
MNEKRILGVHLSERVKDATKLQGILTKYGCSIKTRLGLHDVSEDYCSPCGLVILELTGDLKECDKLEKELKQIKGLSMKKMVFEC